MSRLAPWSLVAVALASVLAPGAAFAKRVAWGSKATAAQTSAAIDTEAASGSSALRKQFGAAVATAFDRTHELGKPLGGGEVVDHQRTRTRGQSQQRVTTMSAWGGSQWSSTRQVSRTRNGTAFRANVVRDTEAGRDSQERAVITDGSRRPKTVTVSNTRRQEDAEGSTERDAQEVFRRGRFGKARLEVATTRVTKTGARASAGNRLESTTTQTWGRETRTEQVTVSDSGKQRVVKGVEKRLFGGKIAISSQEAFGQKGRRPEERSLGKSRQLTVGGATIGLGLQRANVARGGGRGR